MPHRKGSARCPLPWAFMLIGAFVVQTAAAAPPGGPAPMDATGRSLPGGFHDDERLQAKVSLTLKDRPLREVLAAVGKVVPVRLTASPETADDKATLVIRQRSAVDALALLARHLQFRWSRTSRGYELRQDTAEPGTRAKRGWREAARREADREAEWSELHAWSERLHRLGSLSQTDRLKRLTEIDGLLKATDLTPDRRAELTTESAAIRDALRSETASAVAVLRSLTPAQVAQLRKDGTLLLSAEHGSLAPRVLEQVRRTPADDDAFSNPLEHKVWVDATVDLREGWYREDLPRPGERRSRLTMELIVWRERDGKREWGSVSWAPLLPAKERLAPAASPAEDPALNRVVGLDLTRKPRPGARVPTQSESVLTHTRRSWPSRPTLGDVAEVLQQATGLEIIADSFVRSRVDPKWFSERLPLVRHLDRLAWELGYQWQKEGNVVLLRSRSSHWDRAMEVPERVVRPWQERASRPDEVSLDDYADLAAALDDLQSRGMSLYWGWYLDEPWVAPPGGSAFAFHQLRRHLRFWASLKPAQRKEALTGDVLPALQMSDLQRRAFATALTDPDAAPWDPAAAFLASGRALTPSDVLSGGFSLKTAVEWNHQLFEGEKPGEERMQIVAQYPTYRPPNVANLPQGYRWSIVGPPYARDDHTFNYHLNRDQKPTRSATVGILRVRTAPS